MDLPVVVIEEIVTYTKNTSLTHVCKLWRNIIVDRMIKKEQGIRGALYALRYGRISTNLPISLDLSVVMQLYREWPPLAIRDRNLIFEVQKQEIIYLMEQCAQAGRCDLLKLLERKQSIPPSMLNRAHEYSHSSVVKYLTTVRCLRQLEHVQGMSSLSRPLLAHQLHRRSQGDK